mmetsp:Transcript_5179/g.13331  ORF Transcript_5179/g.13331 Transcript_5179/m.13331 type:complete len:232 (+) Transcript_5179:172-867(+)
MPKNHGVVCTIAFPVIISCTHIATTAIIARRPLNISASRAMLLMTGESDGTDIPVVGVTGSKPPPSRFLAVTAAMLRRISAVKTLTSTAGLKIPPLCRAGARSPSTSWLGRPSAVAMDSCIISATGRPTAPSIASRPSRISSFRDCSKCASSPRPSGSKNGFSSTLCLGTAGVSSSAFRTVGACSALRGLSTAAAARPMTAPAVSAWGALLPAHEGATPLAVLEDTGAAGL